MRPKSARQLKAESLRREKGLSYREISALTGINKSTLSNWLRDISLLPEQEARLQDRLQKNRAGFAARSLPINRARHQQARLGAYQAGVSVIASLPHNTAVYELALAMLYLGEGSKSGGRVQMANADAAILRYFLQSLHNLYQIDAKRLGYRLNLVPAAQKIEADLVRWWARELQISPGDFDKTQYDNRSRATQLTGTYHGICTITYADTFLQQRLIGLAQSYTSATSTVSRLEHE
jgi:hypothetical protein